MFAIDPWFWAFLAMVGWFLGLLVVGSATFGRHWVFGLACVVLANLPRVVLPLPLVEQPRINGGLAQVVAGAVVLALTLVFATPALRIRPFTAPTRTEPLRRDGLYALVRHPIMFCDSFWPLGWSLIFGSVIGVALTPVWFGVCVLLTFLEEEKLVEQYGDEYARYQREVPRIIPFLRLP